MSETRKVIDKPYMTKPTKTNPYKVAMAYLGDRTSLCLHRLTLYLEITIDQQLIFVAFIIAENEF